MSRQKSTKAHAQDSRHVKHRRPYSSPVIRKPLPKAVRLALAHRAPRLGRAVRRARDARLVRPVRAEAARERVQRHLVARHAVHALEDVDLAAVGPVRAARPEGGPDGASEGDVVRVEDEHGSDWEEFVRADRDLKVDVRGQSASSQVNETS